MASESKETSAAAQPTPRDDQEMPPARKLHVRSRMRAGLATSLVVGSLRTGKKPPDEAE
jgi:hypothetical protein